MLSQLERAPSPGSQKLITFGFIHFVHVKAFHCGTGSAHTFPLHGWLDQVLGRRTVSFGRLRGALWWYGASFLSLFMVSPATLIPFWKWRFVLHSRKVSPPQLVPQDPKHVVTKRARRNGGAYVPSGGV